MHLLTAKPGEFNEDEGIIDLQQTSGDLVILAGSDGLLSGLAETIEILPDDYPSCRIANWSLIVKPAAFDLYSDQVLEKAKVILISLLGGEAYFSYGLERLVEIAKQNKIHLIVVSGDNEYDENLSEKSTVLSPVSHQAWSYMRMAGPNNLENLFLFLGQAFFLKNYEWVEPRQVPKIFIYDPIKHFGSLLGWKQSWHPEFPIVIVLIYRSHIQHGNQSMFIDLLELMQAKELNPLPVVFTSLKDEDCLKTLNSLIDSVDVKIIFNTTSFSLQKTQLNSEKILTAVESSIFSKPLPNIQAILSSYTMEDWDKNPQGLRPKDIAMYVALPELDGRIISRVISFRERVKSQERCQWDVIKYHLYKERAEFVVDSVKLHCNLSKKSNDEKRVACILANYPTKDGRIGNGVGLDVPASAMNILHALKDDGYQCSSLPKSSMDLITQLQAGVTNDLDRLHLKQKNLGIYINDYIELFTSLPRSVQEAVIERWGDPYDDVKYYHGQILISGILFHHVFVGIQPARGFNIDLDANYHDPDLIPPHSYLAFYFWLRYRFECDAVIHIGKHGNLEWLPGKSLGLSKTCWPDIVLGPIPNFYPFIVNDPGEGAQAKRRTQAVIIDHLMPPVSRAEQFGDLMDLEELVDEYYQALTLDDKRQEYLKEKIFKLLKKSHVIHELQLSKQSLSGNDINDDELLNSLDAYLCDIKESQIRVGLHTLGASYSEDKVVGTLLSLVRLPRGTSPRDQSILLALVKDLDIEHKDFNPLDPSTGKWSYKKPEILIRILPDKPWWNQFDARERLELLALELIKDQVFNEPSAVRHLFKLDKWINTQKVLTFVNTILLNILKTSYKNEIEQLLRGLQGQFVPPGPSGAPTRGRLDTLPTGRNFYSLDNRSIPTKTAWELGQKSAIALVQRHLQEHGDYPKSLGMSVWGTSTMRTGGDDIAQAFALMGIKPIWAAGSNRVVDFEITPHLLMAHPRIDITLRVSGFFRDAFPNVIELFDAAVNALVDYDSEPLDNNFIRKQVSKTFQQLQEQGVNDHDARRKASYRVFGSKPGAYGAGLQGLIDERCWEISDDLADAYIQWSGYAYGQKSYGKAEHHQFSDRLKGIDVVIQNQDNREHDLLDSDDYYQFQGGMTNAIKSVKGDYPQVYHGDHSNPASPKIRTLKEELNRVIRSRVTNPKWIKGMQDHGYKGAFEMSASVDYMFAYDATTGSIDDYQYEHVCSALLLDENNQQFMNHVNPQALKEMAERFLEAIHRGLWHAKQETINDIEQVLIDLDSSDEIFESTLEN